ncbi:Uncharacterized protein PA52Ts2_1820 [Pseudomonas aeruginosa]|jgi:hypothetical protein|nr:hypothetical protein CSC30_1675 [Pseudomonas aeruginosa]QJE76782.1 Uncharacterized protein PA52Ts1_1823 [Pseudomonas aeruginosa]QJE83224.1 Uncharacterized protein PA52Ts2_1820 [Pseudomonas aeruginosa]QJE89608.1 Uncharacterized protein PA52Ts17_1817 [Pseudomonas aeruginosa]QLJ87732.1 Uncharacterized protein PA52Ts32_1837 [Pseudomonas aeruginosa]
MRPFDSAANKALERWQENIHGFRFETPRPRKRASEKPTHTFRQAQKKNLS